MPQVPRLRIGPLVPNRHPVVVQVLDVGVAVQEPKQFVDDRAQVEFLGRQARKTGLQVEPHLMAEYADRSGSGAVALPDAVVADVLQ